MSLIVLVLGITSLIVLHYFRSIGPRDPKVEVGGMILKSVSELLKVTVLEIPVVSDPSHPTEFRRAKGCVAQIL